MKKLVAIDVVLRGRISRIHGCRNAVELKVVLLSKVTGGVGDGMMPQLPVLLFGISKCFSVSGSVQFSIWPQVGFARPGSVQQATSKKER